MADQPDIYQTYLKFHAMALSGTKVEKKHFYTSDPVEGALPFDDANVAAANLGISDAKMKAGARAKAALLAEIERMLKQ